ncbi:MAG: DUF1599 domain-containing protein [Bacteroidales bacterium]|nr:DUF1599 domain-containing protein [Bacteroidales bacterium]
MQKMDTSEQFDEVIKTCRNIFIKKMKDYGTSWYILRTSSLTDQIFIKANRIRNIQLVGEQMVDDDITSEFIGIVNYAVMALIKLRCQITETSTTTTDELTALYDRYLAETKALMMKKNHDYGEAWRQMRISSLDDIILMKIMRVKQIEDNDGKVLISEGLDANYMDMINYAVFALIKLFETNVKKEK